MVCASYRLADDAYACLADGHLVFSDIRSDRYQCLSRTHTLAALRMLPGFPLPGDTYASRIADTSIGDAQIVMRALADSGLVVARGTEGKAFRPVRVPPPAQSRGLPGTVPVPDIRFEHRMSFVRASLAASAKLRLLSLRRTIHTVEARKQRSRQVGTDATESSQMLSSVFHRLRPYYLHRRLCRFDSLALIEFLARYRRFPLWVFGVRCEPFGAHCWVQEGDCVLNDSLGQVRQYAPIMAF